MGQTKETFYFPCIISLFHNPVFINCAWERDPLGTDFLTRMRRATQDYTMLKRRCARAHLRPVTSLTSRYGVRDICHRRQILTNIITIITTTVIIITIIINTSPVNIKVKHSLVVANLFINYLPLSPNKVLVEVPFYLDSLPSLT